MKHILELTAKYKMGHQHLSTPIAIIGRNIVRVEKIPEEIPDFLDGCLTRVQTSVGENIAVAEDYPTVLQMWQQSLEHEM